VRRSFIGTGIFLAIFVGFTLWELHVLKDRPLTVSDIRWECEEQRCLVRFMVQNETDEPVAADVVITARARHQQQGADTATIVQVGKGSLPVELQPFVSREMVYGLSVDEQPDFISVRTVGDDS
jgi:hypothetical protein